MSEPEGGASPRGANWIALGALWGALAVVTGAFGAHGLRERLAPEEMDLWRTAVLYHALHAPALVLYGLFRRAGGAGWAGVLLLGGSLVFSGTVYALALGGPRWLGAVTPLGGGALVLGWLAFAWEARRGARYPRDPRP